MGMENSGDDGVEGTPTSTTTTTKTRRRRRTGYQNNGNMLDRSRPAAQDGDECEHPSGQGHGSKRSGVKSVRGDNRAPARTRRTAQSGFALTNTGAAHDR